MGVAMELVGSTRFKFRPNQLTTLSNGGNCSMHFAIANKLRIRFDLGRRKNV